jgi:hypothetical protein
MTPGGGGVLVSWLVSLLSGEIKGFYPFLVYPF